MRWSRLQAIAAACVTASVTAIAAQTPVPFPRPGQPSTPKPVVAPAGDEPSEASLGVPLYPSAQFLVSFDAGRGQRYYLFGTNATFGEVVAFFRTALKQRGELVFEAPATHMFDIGRFREETMAFPPSVTVKDYTWGGSKGYLNPKRGAQPARFGTVIQIVPVPPGAAR
jgi:hypothetical protein